MDEFIPWTWAVFALIFLIAEIFTAGFFLICFAFGAGAAAILAFWNFSMAWQMSAFILVSAAAVIFSRPLANRISGNQSNSVGIDRVLHKEAIVIVPIDPQNAQGRVRVEREEWLAESVDDKIIPAGAKVVVLEVKGTRLRVRHEIE
ncbi:MAG: NfeD family protein [Caldilineaceae bacterium]